MKGTGLHPHSSLDHHAETLVDDFGVAVEELVATCINPCCGETFFVSAIPDLLGGFTDLEGSGLVMDGGRVRHRCGGTIRFFVWGNQ